MRVSNSLLIILIGLGSTSCLQTRSQVQAQEEIKLTQEQVKNLQVNRADTQNKMQEVSQVVLQLNGRIEGLEAKMNGIDRGFQAKNRQGDQQIVELSARIKTLEDALLGTNQKLDEVVQELQRIRSAKVSESKSSGEGKGPEKGPFVMAEDDFSKNHWGEAILNYMKYREQNPKGKRFAEATFKIGYSFQQLGKGAQAKSFYQEVVERFPGTPHAKKAQAQLQKL